MATGLQFNFQIPTNIVFGVGSLDTIGTHAKQLGLKKPMLVTDKIIGKTEGVKRALDLLGKEGISAVVWDEIGAEPTDKVIVEGLGVYRAQG